LIIKILFSPKVILTLSDKNSNKELFMNKIIISLVCALSVQAQAFLDETTNNNIHIENKNINHDLVNAVKAKIDDCYSMEMEKCVIYAPHKEVNQLSQTLISLNYTNIEVKGNKFTIFLNQENDCREYFNKINFTVADYADSSVFKTKLGEDERIVRLKKKFIEPKYIELICSRKKTTIITNLIADKVFVSHGFFTDTYRYEQSEKMKNRTNQLLEELSNNKYFKVKFDKSQIYRDGKEYVSQIVIMKVDK
jgi:hypothetical protein